MNLKLKTRFKKRLTSLCFAATFIGVLPVIVPGCADQEQSLDEQAGLLKLQTLPEVTHPVDNPGSDEKVRLGKLLFYDPICSGEKDITCYTCHLPSLGYGDAIDLSIGPGGTGLAGSRVNGAGRALAIRNSTSIVNSAYVGLTNSSQSLDVSAAPMTWAVIRRPLEAQTFGALGNPAHMRGKGSYDAPTAPDSIARRLKNIAEYVTLFDRAFGGGAASVTKENLGKAIAAFERSVVSRNSPYDQYAKGRRDALTDKQKAGLLLFFGKANCVTCHTGPMFSDYGLYNLGVKDHPALPDADLGFNMERLFRTPSLRNVALTAPYMHNGTIATLKEVIQFYNKGEPENPNVSRQQMSIKIEPLHLSETEVEELLSFLEALTDDSYDKQIPLSVPSGLKPGGY